MTYYTNGLAGNYFKTFKQAWSMDNILHQHSMGRIIHSHDHAWIYTANTWIDFFPYKCYRILHLVTSWAFNRSSHANKVTEPKWNIQCGWPFGCDIKPKWPGMCRIIHNDKWICQWAHRFAKRFTAFATLNMTGWKSNSYIRVFHIHNAHHCNLIWAN